MKGLSNAFASISAGEGEMIYYQGNVATSSPSGMTFVSLGGSFTDINELKAIIFTGAYNDYDINSDMFLNTSRPMIAFTIYLDDRSQDKILYLEQENNIPVLKSTSALCTLKNAPSSSLIGYDVTFPDNITTSQSMFYYYTLIGQKQS